MKYIHLLKESKEHINSYNMKQEENYPTKMHPNANIAHLLSPYGTRCRKISKN